MKGIARLIVLLSPLLMSACMTTVRHNIPKSVFAPKTIPADKQTAMTFSLTLENPQQMSDWVAREADISKAIKTQFLASGYFKSVRETKEPSPFHIAFDVKMRPNPNELAYAYLAGTFLLAIPIWYSHDVELSAEVLQEWQKVESFFDRESVTRIWWLPLFPVGPFSTFGTAAQEIQRNYFGQILSRLEQKGILPIRALTKEEPPKKVVSGAPTEIHSKYDNILDCVVIIATAEGIGSGFLVSKTGHVVTNAHVVGENTTVSVKFRNGQSSIGVVQKRDPTRDLAVVRVQGGPFPWLALGSRSEAELGNDVLAVGAPKNLGWSIAKGIVSAIRSENGVSVIQTDAAVNSGNSGGPLINPQTGRVLGVNSFGFRKDLSEGLNFAIAADEVKKSFPDVAAEFGK